jgi:3-oxoacyl-[acyl-carrier-protein] synthase-3
MNRAKIVGLGAYAPKQILTNRDLEKMVETTDEWIVRRTGIRERHIAEEGEATSDLAVRAAQQALERAAVEPDEVDFIVVATTSADMPFPSTANFVQLKLGTRQAGSVDVWAACTGSLYGLSIGAQYIQTGKYRTVLAIGAETFSRITDWTDRGTCILLGDAAGAAVLRPSPDGSGILDTDLYSDGQYWPLLYQPGGGTKHPASHETVEKRMHYVKMKGNEVFKVAVRMLEECSLAILKKNGLTPEQVDLFIPHQANLRIIEAAVKRLRLPMEKVLVNIDRYGNTGAASVYVALEEAWSQGRIKPGDLLLFAAFGGGFTWGSALVRW